MPQANEVELTSLYSASTGLAVQDNEPNAPTPGGPPAAKFDLNLGAVAGMVSGNSGANYVLTLTCIDETLAAPNAAMSIGPLNQALSAADGWVPRGAAGMFVNERTFPIAVPGGVSGHVFHY